jgi:glycosyltransferase involved in cell wall biosynthesis
VIVTPLITLLPFAAKVSRGPKTVLINVNACTSLRRLKGARRRLLQASLAAADRIVCLAEAQRAELLRAVPLDPGRVRTVRLGVDDRFYRPRPEPAVQHVLAVGRDLGRDYATFIDAVARLDVPATIVASARNVVGLELPSNIDVELDVTPERLRDLYSAATCVVIPTRAQEFDRGADCSGQTVLLDAMAMGRPVVITQRSTLASYVTDGESALVVPPEDSTALVDAIHSLLSEPDRRRAIAENGHALVQRELTTADFAASLAPILEELG